MNSGSSWMKTTRDVSLTLALHLIEVGQLGGSVNGARRLQRAHHGVHQQDMCQRLLDELRVLRGHRAPRSGAVARQSCARSRIRTGCPVLTVLS